MGCNRSKNHIKLTHLPTTTLTSNDMSNMLELAGIEDQLQDLKNYITEQNKTKIRVGVVNSSLVQLGLEFNQTKFDVIEVGRLFSFTYLCIIKYKQDGFIECTDITIRIFSALLIVLEDITTKKNERVTELQKIIAYMVNSK
jgi:hypothetical protein